MTTADKLIPVYYWFKSGFGEISIPLSFVNLAILIVTVLTVKGIFITMWMIPVIATLVLIGCIFIGWFFQHYDINSRIVSLVNQKNNPEIKQISDDVKKIKEMLEK